ncbi:Gfo/Idh/MocA family protein [Frigidibacter sp. ROC022]|uniref:Gfo/Idh/MocA family protein n=1 Tax=Frigidibacter sp. ROC022 TaxID=2971796 RepID=UPI00215A3346|nr:Gfo/Idh/MocA family oxidoreductase [Frigidibacter sp. ROC022]MCR8723769.1 Gfo/Idh/MocA family oxidoreductase [Frigidibacter sp. ROC022]
MANSGATDRGGRIRLGMVGGGEGAFIGAVHRIAARLDDRYELVAGALSGSEEKSIRSGVALGLDPKRCYGDFKQMASREARRKDGIEAVAVVTPNHMHFPASKEFLKRGIHVICDKPLTATMAEARAFEKAVAGSEAIFCLTHNYTGYPMVRQARAMVAAGELGEIRLLQVEYPQDWLSEPLERTDNKQAGWRTDPKRSGAGALGDIGTHAYNLACFVTGDVAAEISADVHSIVEGRAVDDNAHVMLRMEKGAKGMLWCSQVAVGNENGLKLRVYGSKGGIEWMQTDPNYLWFTPFGEPKRLITRNGAGATEAGMRVSRVPAGHPEGYLEGFATIYREVADAIVARREGAAPDPAVEFPGIAEGMAGMRFIAACLASSKRNGAWVKP